MLFCLMGLTLRPRCSQAHSGQPHSKLEKGREEGREGEAHREREAEKTEKSQHNTNPENCQPACHPAQGKRVSREWGSWRGWGVDPQLKKKQVEGRQVMGHKGR